MTSSLASAPAEQPPIPAAVLDAAKRYGGEPECVWLNQEGGTTWRLDSHFVKWNPAASIESLGEEFQRMRWLQARFPCPEAVEFAAEDDGELLVSTALPGAGAVTDTWLAEPETAVRAIAEGLRRLHSLETSDCPFMSDVPASADDDLVLTQGDACAPNTVLSADGTFCGIVDLARIGVADRWLDLSVAAMSLGWNYGQGFEPVFYEAYGIAPNEERMRFWQEWWNLET